MIIDTIETEQQRYFLRLLALQDCPVLFVGPTGTGKSAITNNFLLQLPRDKYIITNVNFSAQTSANQTQDMIFTKLMRYACSRFYNVCNLWCEKRQVPLQIFHCQKASVLYKLNSSSSSLLNIIFCVAFSVPQGLKLKLKSELERPITRLVFRISPLATSQTAHHLQSNSHHPQSPPQEPP